MKRDAGSPTERPAALFLAPEAPYPLAGGGAIRSASLFEYLAARYTVDVIVFREPGAPDPAAAFPSGKARAIHVIDLPHHGSSTWAWTARNTARLLRGTPPLVDRFSGFGQRIAAWIHERTYDLAVIEHFWCAPYAEQAASAAKRTVLDLHNIESVLHARCASTERGAPALAHRIFSRASRKLEKTWFPRFDLLLAASEEDARLVRGISPAAQIAVYPNALPLTAKPERAEEEMIAFSANFGYQPNASAVRFFAAKIWPVLRARWPGIVWRLIGKNAEAVTRMVQGDPRVQVTGPVPDALEELAAAKVVVAPLLSGSGTRFKIIEAWAAGRPVVSTRVGAEGLPARPGENILLVDEPMAFAESVSGLLSSPGERARLGASGRATFESQLTWKSAWETLDL